MRAGASPGVLHAVRTLLGCLVLLALVIPGPFVADGISSPQPTTAVVEVVRVGSPAARSGLQAGDRLVGIDDSDLSSFVAFAVARFESSAHHPTQIEFIDEIQIGLSRRVRFASQQQVCRR